MKTRRIALCAGIAGMLLVTSRAPAQQELLNFGKDFDPAKVLTTDAEVQLAGGALKVRTFHAQPWPGVTLLAPAGRWDLWQYEHVAVEVKNLQEAALTIFCRVDNPGADGTNNCVTGSARVQAGATATIRVRFSRRGAADVASRLFGMRGYPAGYDPKGTMDPANVTQLVVFVNRPAQDHEFEIRSIRAAGTYTGPKQTLGADAFFPFIDEFGQYIHKDWPGKVHSLQELRARVAQEAADLEKQPGPKDWNEYGGWKAGPALKATGFFRTEKHDGKWWLVDPEGRLFWSHGVDCVRMQETTPIDQRESWFRDFPGNKPEFAEFLVPSTRSVLMGHYAGQRPRCFSFGAANLKRKYRVNWQQATAEIAHRRLRSWGMNTIGNWSDRSVYLMRRTPYVCTVSSGRTMIEGSEGYWGKFPDPFDPRFRDESQRNIAAAAGQTANDPWCIGYFVDNEMSWGDEVSLAVAVLKSPPTQTAKRVFLEDLRAAYGTIERLNQAWGTQHASWKDLLESREPPDAKKARRDLTAFYTRIAEEYFRIVREALKAVAPNQLYLGCRFAWVNPLAVAASAKYCDVVSYNLYRRSVADFRLPVDADVPLIIGEFHFGALDRGMFHTGLVPTENQQERAEAYREYVRGCLSHAQFVGCHWFQYRDQPTTGRALDEENYQIGLVDIADTPYSETLQAVREVGQNMYRMRSGR